MPTDAIVMLKEDHRRIRGLFLDFLAAHDRAHATRSRVMGRILGELRRHTFLEEECLFQEVRRRVPGLDQEVLESCEEHHVADVLGSEIASLAADAENYRAKAMVLIETVTHHMENEEEDLFPRVRVALGRAALCGIGDSMQALSREVPGRAETSHQPQPSHRHGPASPPLLRRV